MCNIRFRHIYQTHATSECLFLAAWAELAALSFRTASVSEARIASTAATASRNRRCTARARPLRRYDLSRGAQGTGRPLVDPWIRHRRERLSILTSIADPNSRCALL